MTIICPFPPNAARENHTFSRPLAPKRTFSFALPPENAIQRAGTKENARDSTMATEDRTYDLFVIGGGINGCGIARDATGRGLSVVLAEMNDLASATSSASTKLFHGGLRYL
jgi:heterodisulfide reductase subunit A-like polyferredoxin